MPALKVQRLEECREGGTEHDVCLVGDPVQELWRITKPTANDGQHGYGFIPAAVPILHLGPATPLQYLTRLELLGRLFPTLGYQLKGLMEWRGRIEIVTSQHFIPGKLLTDEAREDIPKRALRLIEHWFQRRGYQKLYLDQVVGPSMAWYHAGENVAIFDAKPANLLIWEDALFPVDVIPVQPTGELLKKIRQAL